MFQGLVGKIYSAKESKSTPLTWYVVGFSHHTVKSILLVICMLEPHVLNTKKYFRHFTLLCSWCLDWFQNQMVTTIILLKSYNNLSTYSWDHAKISDRCTNTLMDGWTFDLAVNLILFGSIPNIIKILWENVAGICLIQDVRLMSVLKIGSYT